MTEATLNPQPASPSSNDASSDAPRPFPKHTDLPVGVELGLWQGTYQGLALTWLRWWDAQGNLLPLGHERAEQEHARAEQEHERAEQAIKARHDAIPRLIALGLDNEQIAAALELSLDEIKRLR